MAYFIMSMRKRLLQERMKYFIKMEIKATNLQLEQVNTMVQWLIFMRTGKNLMKRIINRVSLMVTVHHGISTVKKK